jgi:dTDP-glucose 4,6-dehydratase
MVLEQGQVGETYNIGGRQECPNLELVRLLLQLLQELRPDLGDLERLITFVPDRPGRLALCRASADRAMGWRPR